MRTLGLSSDAYFDRVCAADRDARRLEAGGRYGCGSRVMRGDEVREPGRGSRTWLVIGYEAERSRAMLMGADGRVRTAPFDGLALVSRKDERERGRRPWTG